LNNVSTIIGRVIEGIEILDMIEREPVGELDQPLNEIKIHKVIIHANPIADNE
jgi:peptidyl-prolyl cis-trans isomerase-like 3